MESTFTWIINAYNYIIFNSFVLSYAPISAISYKMDNFFSLQTFFRWPVIATYYISNDLPHDYGEQFQIVNVNLEVFYLNVDI